MSVKFQAGRGRIWDRSSGKRRNKSIHRRGERQLENGRACSWRPPESGG